MIYRSVAESISGCAVPPLPRRKRRNKSAPKRGLMCPHETAFSRGKGTHSGQMRRQTIRTWQCWTRSPSGAAKENFSTIHKIVLLLFGSPTGGHQKTFNKILTFVHTWNSVKKMGMSPSFVQDATYIMVAWYAYAGTISTSCRTSLLPIPRTKRTFSEVISKGFDHLQPLVVQIRK